MKKELVFIYFLSCIGVLVAQQNRHIKEKFVSTDYLEDTLVPVKVKHAEPLYIDLIRDLGARKGEKEWNVGFGLIDNLNHDEYEALVEYEWAVADRIGLEVELPFLFYSSNSLSKESAPSNRIESIKLAGQWSFIVNPKTKSSLALGYINELEFVDLDVMDSKNVFQENIFNPFVIAAQRIGANWHSLIYTGPNWKYALNNGHVTSGYEAHFNLHYMIPNTNNFVGFETNMNWERGDFITILRPQMRVDVTEEIKLGLVVGVPLEKADERMSFFIRMIWEPGP